MRTIETIAAAGLIGLAVFITAGCKKPPDLNTPEGQFQACYNSVEKVCDDAASILKTNGNLDGINSIDNVLRQKALTKEEGDKLVDDAYTACDSIVFDVEKGTTNYTVTATTKVDSKCQIIGNAAGITPKSLADCQK